MNIEDYLNFVLKQLFFWIPNKNLRRKTRSKFIRYIIYLLVRRQVCSYKRARVNRGKGKVIVYTAITGSYDKMQEHSFFDRQWDFRFYTDQKIESLNKDHLWEVTEIPQTEESDLNRVAKKYKILPHRFLSDYEYSIWIDGNISLTGAHLIRLFKEFIKSEKVLGISKHPFRNSVKEEIAACLEAHKDTPEKIQGWKRVLDESTFTDDQGLFEMNVILRRHNDPICVKIMEDWWEIIRHYSKRDQLSFTYALWKNTKKIEDVAFVNNIPIRSLHDYKFTNHQSS